MTNKVNAQVLGFDRPIFPKESMGMYRRALELQKDQLKIQILEDKADNDPVKALEYLEAEGNFIENACLFIANSLNFDMNSSYGDRLDKLNPNQFKRIFNEVTQAVTGSKGEATQADLKSKSSRKAN